MQRASDQPNTIDQRKNPRIRCVRSIEAVSIASDCKVRLALLDCSLSGLGARSPQSFEVGEQLLVDIDELDTVLFYIIRYCAPLADGTWRIGAALSGYTHSGNELRMQSVLDV